jgi:hypothetical protein
VLYRLVIALSFDDLIGAERMDGGDGDGGVSSKATATGVTYYSCPGLYLSSQFLVF